MHRACLSPTCLFHLANDADCEPPCSKKQVAMVARPLYRPDFLKGRAVRRRHRLQEPTIARRSAHVGAWLWPRCLCLASMSMQLSSPLQERKDTGLVRDCSIDRGCQQWSDWKAVGSNGRKQDQNIAKAGAVFNSLVVATIADKCRSRCKGSENQGVFVATVR